jgi:hypothetical protein
MSKQIVRAVRVLVAATLITAVIIVLSEAIGLNLLSLAE